MTVPQDVTPLVRNWLREPDGLPPPRIAAVAPLVHHTPQQRGAMPPLQRRFQSMFSATKIVLAGVIVALFGSVLLAGVLTPPSDDVSDAARVASAVASATAAPEASVAAPPTIAPTPASGETTVRTDILPGVSLTVQEIEPGLFRVLSDGVRDLTEDGILKAGIAAGFDGGTWLFNEHGFFRLGEERHYRWPKSRDSDPSDVFASFVGYTGLAEGGVVDRSGIYWHPASFDARARYDGRSWINPKIAGHSPKRCHLGGPWCILDVVAGTDGSVWVVVNSGVKDDAFRVARLKNGRWKVFPPETNEVYLIGATQAGKLWMTVSGPEDTELSWLTSITANDRDHADMGELFERIGNASLDEAAVSSEGTLWVYTELSRGDKVGEGKLARLSFDSEQGRRWAVYDSPSVGLSTGFDPERRMEVAPDGSVWVNLGAKNACGGLGHLDGGPFYGDIFGSEWTRYLDGMCVWGLDIASDGTVWLQARNDGGPLETYVIPPSEG